MSQDFRGLQWVTPARYVGPMMLIVLSIGALLGLIFAGNGRVNEAVLVLLFTICFLLIGIADLLGELIKLTMTSRPPSSGPDR
ncbi:MAG TPA: hypothetical protein VJV23_06470 [Candidatus Polarisedimenticolia bacterium]|nr:hypothetical protein [Candidatus Polarisedimenticolia bacterium]